MDAQVSDDLWPPDADAAATNTDAYDPALEELRGILSEPDRRRADDLARRVADLERRTGDDPALVTAITPVLGDVIRRKIQEDRAEMIEALYPIIAQLIGRAVAEAIRDLARTIDVRMRATIGPATLLRRLRARLTGVPEAELMLRDVLPFRVTEILLIHRESGLLLQGLTSEPEADRDADIVSAMLTAIRDFVQDAFGHSDPAGQLDEIQYGTQRILLETTRHITLAVVVDGIEPAGFRELMRQRLIEVENGEADRLASYDGDASRFLAVRPKLRTLMTETPRLGEVDATGLTRRQRRIVVLLAVSLLLCLLAACGAGAWWLRSAAAPPAPAVMVVVTATPGPTATPSPTPTATPSPTATSTVTPPPTATPTLAPSLTATRPATATVTRTRLPDPTARVGQLTLNVRAAPSLSARVLEQAGAGRAFRIVGRDELGGWWQVCCTADGGLGWIAAALVQVEGAVTDVPVVMGE